MTDGPTRDRAALVEELLERLARGDRRGAVARAHELLDEGLDADALLDLVTEAQREVGRRWERNEWSIVQEHTATAVSEDVVSAISSRLTTPEVELGRVAVACADGEWHILPARLLAEHLEHHGFDVVFVGGSVPPDHLAEYLPRLDVGALAVSVSISAHLDGAARTVAAAHAAGLPVLVGGTAFDADATRATTLGADGYAATPAEAEDVLAAWLRERPEPLATAELRRPPYHALVRDRGAIVTQVVDDLTEAAPIGAGARIEEVRAVDVRQHLDYVQTAVLLDDPGVYADFLPWVTLVQGARGVDGRELEVLVDRLAVRLDERRHDAAVAVVETARRRLGSAETV